MSRVHVHKIVEVNCLEVPKWTENRPATLHVRCTCDAVAQGAPPVLLVWWRQHLETHMLSFPAPSIAFHLQASR